MDRKRYFNLWPLFVPSVRCSMFYHPYTENETKMTLMDTLNNNDLFVHIQLFKKHYHFALWALLRLQKNHIDCSQCFTLASDKSVPK